MNSNFDEDAALRMFKAYLNGQPIKVMPVKVIGIADGPSYYEMEHAPDIQCNITDRDMLLLQIDMAIDAGDSELFMQLTNRLKEMEVLV